MLRRFFVLVILGVLAALAHMSAAAERPADEVLYIHITPTSPGPAKSFGGKVEALITANKAGAVTAVDILSETPAGYGFADATRAQLKTWTFTDGKGGTYRIDIIFSTDEKALQAADAAAAPPDALAQATGLPRAPDPVYKVRPAYPAAAQVRNIDGDVVLIVDIDASGAVTKASIFSEKPRERGFGTAARKAIRKWRYPANKAGRYYQALHFGVMTSQEREKYEDDFVLDNMLMAPAPLTRTAPVYPEEARKASRDGDVRLAIVISDTGRVSRSSVIGEAPTDLGFAASAREAVADWTFDPATPSGTYVLDIPFRIAAPKSPSSRPN